MLHPHISVNNMFVSCRGSFLVKGKKSCVGKSKEELTLEKRMELERRLQDVSGQLNSVKKPTKPKGELAQYIYSVSVHVGVCGAHVWRKCVHLFF